MSTKKPQEKKPSEIVEDFLEYMKFCQKEYQSCISEVYKHDKQVQDFLHEFEFSGNKQERNRIATRVSVSRKERRKLKDRAKLFENAARFFGDKSNKQFFDRLRSLIKEQKKEEEYLSSERIYKPRGGAIDGNPDRQSGKSSGDQENRNGV